MEILSITEVLQGRDMKKWTVMELLHGKNKTMWTDVGNLVHVNKNADS
jgi:hypothetical protein